MVVDDEVIKYINALPEHCIYAVEDKKSKTVYINHTGNFIAKLRELSGHGDTIKVLCSGVGDRVYKLIFCEYYANKYINNGWVVINRGAPFISFRVVSRIDTYKTSVQVYLSSARREKMVVGIFKNFREANSFIDMYYGGNWDGLPVYAINRESVEYWKYINSLNRRKQPKDESNGVVINEVTQ